MKKFVLAGAAAVLIAGCSDSGTADADGDGTITQEEVAAEVADGPAVAMRAGRWEHTVQFSELNVPGVPAGMEDMVKQQMGSGITTSRCMTEEEVNRPNADFFGGEKQQNCTYEEFDRSGNRMTLRMTCDAGNGAKANVAMDGEFGSDSFELQLDNTVTGSPAGDVTMKGTISGKRIGDC